MNKIVKIYLDCYKNLDRFNLEKMMRIVDDDIFFYDPFHTIKGKEKLRVLLKKFIEKFGEINFKIIKVANNSQNYFVKWSLLVFYSGKKIEFVGISELTLRGELIISHIDYWDSGRNFYANLPLIGKIFQLIHN